MPIPKRSTSEPVSDIDTATVDSLKVLDPKRPIREADIVQTLFPRPLKSLCHTVFILGFSKGSCFAASAAVCKVFPYDKGIDFEQ